MVPQVQLGYNHRGRWLCAQGWLRSEDWMADWERWLWWHYIPTPVAHTGDISSRWDSLQTRRRKGGNKCVLTDQHSCLFELYSLVNFDIIMSPPSPITNIHDKFLSKISGLMRQSSASTHLLRIYSRSVKPIKTLAAIQPATSCKSDLLSVINILLV